VVEGGTFARSCGGGMDTLIVPSFDFMLGLVAASRGLMLKIKNAIITTTFTLLLKRVFPQNISRFIEKIFAFRFRKLNEKMAFYIIN
jgi:hypothetical protein